MTFHTLWTVICVRMTCYFPVHMKYKSSFHLGKAIRDSKVQSSLNWHGKWKGRGERPEEVVRCCLVTAAAAIPQEAFLAKRERGGPLSTALTLAVLQTCLQGVRAKEYAAEESLRHWIEAVSHKSWLHLHQAAVLQAWCCLWGDWHDADGQQASKQLSKPQWQPALQTLLFLQFTMISSLQYPLWFNQIPYANQAKNFRLPLTNTANIRHNSRPDTDGCFQQNLTMGFAPHLEGEFFSNVAGPS